MAFPAVFNISYYRGDTYEFRIYPKDANGNAFPLTGYDANEGVKFTMSTFVLPPIMPAFADCAAL